MCSSPLWLRTSADDRGRLGASWKPAASRSPPERQSARGRPVSPNSPAPPQNGARLPRHGLPITTPTARQPPGRRDKDTTTPTSSSRRSRTTCEGRSGSQRRVAARQVDHVIPSQSRTDREGRRWRRTSSQMNEPSSGKKLYCTEIFLKSTDCSVLLQHF